MSTAEDVRMEILRWGGNLTAAAESLGVSVWALRKRLRSLEIDLAAVRSAGLPQPPATDEGAAQPPSSNERQPTSTNSAQPDHGPRTRIVTSNSTGRVGGRRLGVMQSTAGLDRALEDDRTPVRLPVRSKKPRQNETFRLDVAQRERLREGRLDLQAKYRLETDDPTVLQQFFDEAFGAWLAQKLGVEPTPPKANGRRGKKGEEER